MPAIDRSLSYIVYTCPRLIDLSNDCRCGCEAPKSYVCKTCVRRGNFDLKMKILRLKMKILRLKMKILRLKMKKFRLKMKILRLKMKILRLKMKILQLKNDDFGGSDAFAVGGMSYKMWQISKGTTLIISTLPAPYRPSLTSLRPRATSATTVQRSWLATSLHRLLEATSFRSQPTITVAQQSKPGRLLLRALVGQRAGSGTSTQSRRHLHSSLPLRSTTSCVRCPMKVAAVIILQSAQSCLMALCCSQSQVKHVDLY